MDSTVRSQNSNDSRAESCMESKHSKEILISEKHHRQPQPQEQQSQQQQQQQQQQTKEQPRAKDDSNLQMFTSCGQLLLGVILVVFGVLVLVHGASLGGSGAGLWAGAGALVAGALGVVATLATTADTPRYSGFSTAHLASSLVALALSNMAAITALTAVVRDSQRAQETSLVIDPVDGSVVEVEGGWAGLLASVGLLVASVAELLLSAYTCVTLTPKLCGCLRSNPENGNEGRLKTHNMVHQWVTAQNYDPKSQPVYLVQHVMPVPAVFQAPYGMTAAAPGKYPGGLIAAGTVPVAASGYKMPVLPQMPYPSRPSSQMVRMKHKRHVPVQYEDSAERRRQPEAKHGAVKKMATVGEDQVDLAQTYTGLDKKMSEEFISIAMDPDRKSKASSRNSSEIGSGRGKAT